MNQIQNLLTEGETYNVHNFVVRQYGAMQTDRCFDNDVFIQLYHLTEISVAEGVDYIQRHVFKFTELSAIIDDTRENKFLIGKSFLFSTKSLIKTSVDFPNCPFCFLDVVGILQQRQPITSYRNKYNQLKHSIHFTINDMLFVFIFLSLNVIQFLHVYHLTNVIKLLTAALQM